MSYINDRDSAQNTTIRDTWHGQIRHWINWSNMNKALIKRFSSLITHKHRDLYTLTHINNPNGTFQECFEYFYKECGIRDELELEDSWNQIMKPWNPSEGFQVLRKHFGGRITFVVFAENTIKPSSTLNMLINVIIKTGMC